jgi:glutamine amidotransferase-like uncharacterized protein
MKKNIIFNIMFLCGSLAVAFPTSEAERELLPEAAFQKQFKEDKDTLPDSFIQKGDKKKIALYIGKGTWSYGKTHLKRFFLKYKHSYEVITAKEIIQGKLNFANYRVIVMPGGKSWKYIEELGPQGAQIIKNFVDQGGGYFGICAGAYYAVSHRQGPSKNPESYGIGLLRGIALDGTVLKVPPFRGGMMKIDTYMSDFKSSYDILMLGGASFHYDPVEMLAKKVRILGTISPIQFPTMIYFNFGKGKVFLTGPHVEIEESDSILGIIHKDPDSEWPFIEKILTSL